MVIIVQIQVITIVYGRHAYACHDAVGLSNSQFVFSPQSIDQEVLRSDCKAGFLIRVVAFGDKRLFHLLTQAPTAAKDRQSLRSLSGFICASCVPGWSSGVLKATNVRTYCHDGDHNAILCMCAIFSSFHH